MSRDESTDIKLYLCTVVQSHSDCFQLSFSSAPSVFPIYNGRRIFFTIQNYACDLHSVVKKGIEGDLWGHLRVRLWPCDVQHERFGVLEVSYLLYIVKVESITPE